MDWELVPGGGVGYQEIFRLPVFPTHSGILPQYPFPRQTESVELPKPWRKAWERDLIGVRNERQKWEYMQYRKHVSGHLDEHWPNECAIYPLSPRWKIWTGVDHNFSPECGDVILQSRIGSLHRLCEWSHYDRSGGDWAWRFRLAGRRFRSVREGSLFCLNDRRKRNWLLIQTGRIHSLENGYQGVETVRWRNRPVRHGWESVDTNAQPHVFQVPIFGYSGYLPVTIQYWEGIQAGYDPFHQS